MPAFLTRIWKSLQTFFNPSAKKKKTVSDKPKREVLPEPEKKAPEKPKEKGSATMNNPKKVVMHCAATADSVKSKYSVDAVRRWHVQGNGWSDIGYHYYITRDGEVHKGRLDHVQGAHARGQNRNSLGVCYEGTHFPSVPQMDSLIELYLDIKDKYSIDYNEWFGHYQFSNKECPGFKIEDLRSIFKKVS